MKKDLRLVLLIICIPVLSALVAAPIISLTPLSPNVICSTGNDTLFYSVTASGIPANTNVVIYQDANGGFNPYSQGDSIGYIPGNAIPADTVNFGSCVKILGILIDACGVSGTEPNNEYIVLTSGSGVKVSNLGIDFSSQNNSGANNADINTGATPCGYKTPNAALIAGLRVGSCNASNVIPASPSDSIPPNAIILVFTSDSTNVTYNINGLCNTGHPIYVLQSACTRTIGAFTNASNCTATRYRTTTAIDKRQNCTNNFTYDLCNIFNKDGTYAIRQQGIDTASVGNNGIRRNIVDSCGGLDYSQLNFSADTILKYKIPNNFCNSGFHYLKAITHPNGTQPVSNTISYKLVCNDVTATSSTTNICSGDSVKINISSTDPNATLSWTVTGGIAVSGASPGSGNAIRQVLTYSGNTKDSITYTVISNDVGCTKTQTVKVVVNKCTVCAPAFLSPDTVCVKGPVQITNLANCASTYYWNFCSGNLNHNPVTTNLGNVGSALSMPVFVALASDNGVKYAFVTNHTGSVVRLKYGSSYLNAPAVTNFGTMGISGYSQVEGIQIKKDSATGNWYGFTESGGTGSDKTVRLNFGSSLDNTPTVTDFGNLGNTDFPGDIYIFKEGANWYGFISNSHGNSIIRLSFGTSLSNTPTATDLGNFGTFSQVGEFGVTTENGNWYMFVGNVNNITRLSFGNSLLNTPTTASFTPPTPAPYGIRLLNDCGSNFGFITHQNNSITKMTFPTGLSGTPVFANLGNIGGFDFPHSISNIFREGDSVYMFVPNVNTNALSRLVFGNCTNSSIASSTALNPPVYSYDTTGTFNISLTIDEGLPTQKQICKQIVVIDTIKKPDARLNQINCSTDSIRLSVANIDSAASYSWSGPNGFNSTKPVVSIKLSNGNQAGAYIVTTSGRCGTKKDTVSFSLPSLQFSLTGNNQLCNNSKDTLHVAGQFDSIRWNTGAAGNQIIVTTPGNYSATVYQGVCSGNNNVDVNTCTVQTCNPTITGNIPFCNGDSIVLNAGGGFLSYLWNTGQATQTIVVKTPGKYVVSVTGQSCAGKDSVNVILKQSPSVQISGNTSFCVGSQTDLTAVGSFDSVRWSTNETTTSIIVTQSQNYSVTVYKNGCSNSLAVQVTVINPPAPFNLGNDTSFCGNFSKILSTGNQNTQWSTGTTASQITVSQAGTYSAVITNACGSATDTINLFKHDLPVIDIGNDTAFCNGQVQLMVTGVFRSIVWSTGSQDSSIVVSAEGTYSVTVTDGNGCSTTDSIVIASNCVNDVWVPNAFTPNGDGINDIFLVRGNPTNTTIERFTIYNRWGDKVFDKTNILPGDITSGWDGKYKGELQQSEVYGYYVIAKFKNGEKKVLKGSVTLLR